MNSIIFQQLRLLNRSLLRNNMFCRRKLKFLKRLESRSEREIRAYQEHMLKRSLEEAVTMIPAYRRVRKNFTASDATRVLLNEFPIIDKQVLLKDTERYYPMKDRGNPFLIVGKTSGTTGTPLEVYRSYESILWEYAFIKRHWSWSGFREGMKRATLRGDNVVPIERGKPPFWHLNVFENQLFLSSRHLKDSFVDQIIDALADFAPHLLQAYPSTAYQLSVYLQARDHRLHIPFTYTGSEPLYGHQRTLIEDRLQTRIMDFYGMAERVAFASECEYGAMHVNPDYSYLEIVDEQGQPTDGTGFIVGTSFHNHTMPLIRYRLSDVTRWRRGTCSCGRAFPIIEAVRGKYEDTIFGSDGSPVSPSVLTFAFKGLKQIKCSQVAQILRDTWEVRIVPFPGFSKADEIQLVKNIHELVDANISVRIEMRQELQQTGMAKFRWVVNELV